MRLGIFISKAFRRVLKYCYSIQARLKYRISSEGLICGKRIYIECERIKFGRNVSFGNNISISCGSLTIEDGVSFDDNVQIAGVGDVHIGAYSAVGKDVYIDGVGDACLSIGRFCWIGRNAILNATTDLRIENGVCIGVSAKVYTHGFWWEEAEGYTANCKSVTIGDNVWLAMNVAVQPGVTIGSGTMVNTGAVVVGNLEQDSIYMGIPAVKKSAAMKKELNFSEKSEIIFRRLNSTDSGRYDAFQLEHTYYFNLGRTESDFIFTDKPIDTLKENTYYFIDETPSEEMLRKVGKRRIAIIDIRRKIGYADYPMLHKLIVRLSDHTIRITPRECLPEGEK